MQAARALPKLPANAAYILLDNPSRRNALSLATLLDLRAQLTRNLTSPTTGRLLLLPPFRQSILDELERACAPSTAATTNPRQPQVGGENDGSSSNSYEWLVNPSHWRAARAGLPDVLILRSSTPRGAVFSSGHDLRELASLPRHEVKRTFALCAEVMSLLRRSPVPVVAAVEGLVTAAGMQLALSADLTIARGRGGGGGGGRSGSDGEGGGGGAGMEAEARFQLPGAKLGLPCTSPATAVARRLPRALALRMLLTAEPVPAEDLASTSAVEVVTPGEDFEARVARTVESLAGAAAQPAALGKWAFWTQVGIRGGDNEAEGGGDGYEEAAAWAGRVMALHARSADAREGIAAFLEKRRPEWMT